MKSSLNFNSVIKKLNKKFINKFSIKKIQKFTSYLVFSCSLVLFRLE